MNKIIAALITLVALQTSPAQANPEEKFLGQFQLKFTSEVWSPNLNQVPVGDITHDVVYADYNISPTTDMEFSVRQGNSYAFGCRLESVGQQYWLVEQDDAWQEKKLTDITNKPARLEAGRLYLVRVVLTNLKACEGYGTSFMALIKK